MATKESISLRIHWVSHQIPVRVCIFPPYVDFCALVALKDKQRLWSSWGKQLDTVMTRNVWDIHLAP